MRPLAVATAHARRTAPATAGANPELGPTPGSGGGAGSPLPEALSEHGVGGCLGRDTGVQLGAEGLCSPRGSSALRPESRPSNRACPRATATGGLWPRGSISRLSGRVIAWFLVAAGALPDGRLLALLTDGSLCAGTFHPPRTSRPHPRRWAAAPSPLASWGAVRGQMAQLCPRRRRQCRALPLRPGPRASSVLRGPRSGLVPAVSARGPGLQGWGGGRASPGRI